MNKRLNLRHALIFSSLLTLMFAITIIGCGPKNESTLPPVTEAVKAQDTPKEKVDSTLHQADTDAAGQISSGWIIKDLANVRSKPSTNSDVVAQLPRGTEVKLVEIADKWWKVQLADGRTAYLYETLLTTERYVDPWTRFRFDASRVAPGLKIIAGVAGIDGETPSAALTVSSDEWNSLSVEDRRITAESAFNFWSECLKKCGYDPKAATILIRGSSAQELGRVNQEAGKAAFKAK